jgi:polyisoprenyl-phosphate glycosyltransferase
MTARLLKEMTDLAAAHTPSGSAPSEGRICNRHSATTLKQNSSEVYVIIPVFNDWPSLRFLLDDLAHVATELGQRFHVFAVDDGSTEGEEARVGLLRSSPIPLTIITLCRNLGHQRAIAIGLCHAVAETGANRFVIMDSDGEDRVADIPNLLASLRDEPLAVAVARRSKRSESLWFRLFYAAFKYLFNILAGYCMDFGNFSAMNRASAERISCMYELLLHYPAALLSSKLPIIRVPLGRGKRYAGRSKMNFIGLAIHGLSAVAAFSDRVLARMMMGSVAILCAGMLAIAVAVVMKILGATSPGWATTVVGSALALLIETLVATMAGLLIVLNSRQAQIALPSEVGAKLIKCKDYSALALQSVETKNA